MNNKTRQSKYRVVKKASGLVRVEVWAHPDDAGTIRALAKTLSGQRKGVKVLRFLVFVLVFPQVALHDIAALRLCVLSF